ncbi:hypothetical protein BKA61DRAFT_668529 [Leptodontidium sp. MPI-SDFR-AT-0119]|nr:hypothetical protein BKA61DRAFT_668529 [Leptodontidium sp. MPI-SDFR-AT-0119]
MAAIPIGTAPVGGTPPGAVLAWNGAPASGPTYILQRCNIVDIVSHAVVIVTDGAMLNDRQSQPFRQHEWRIRSTNPAGVCNMDLYNQVNNAGFLTLRASARATEGDVAVPFSLPIGQQPAGSPTSILAGPARHAVKIMVNVAPFNPNASFNGVGSERHLRKCVQNALNCYMGLGVMPPPGRPWAVTGPSIAFQLIGSGRLGYGSERAAENVLAAIQGWFNHPVHGAARRAQITTVFLLCNTGPASFVTEQEAAWRRAWDRYVHPVAVETPAPNLVQAVARIEAESLQIQDDNPGLIDSLPGHRGRLTQLPRSSRGSLGIVIPP